MKETEDHSLQPELPIFTMAEFLESCAPNQAADITDLVYFGSEQLTCLNLPDIQLHCPSGSCNGLRFFRQSIDYGLGVPVKIGYAENRIVTYRCSNCGKFEKTFAIATYAESKAKIGGSAIKIGEQPPYGPPTPAKLIKLTGPDRDAFLKGRRCENLGLGIGAFVYYRRVVENQKTRLLQQVKKVAEKINAPKESIDVLNAAIAESQFSKAMDIAKVGIPESLLIGGHNPMKLLHSALSEGLHAQSDDECLAIAKSVRVVLGELSERIGQALKDEHELSEALSILMRPKKSNSDNISLNADGDPP